MVSVSRLPSDNDRAEELLRRFFTVEGESVSRLNTLNQIAGTGNTNRNERRRWAVAWQILTRAGFVCPEAENPKEGDWWFLTPAGAQALNSDFQGSLMLVLGRP